MKHSAKLISVVVPCYNEAANVEPFSDELVAALQQMPHDYEIVYVNDGSRDNTADLLQKLARRHKNVRFVNLTRNFGKEAATTAGLQYARGDAIIMADGDGQHPVRLIPDFVAAWEQGAPVVTGVRNSYHKESIVKKLFSKLFYTITSRLANTQFTAGATDFRLIDRSVQQEFLRLTERNRITRGLIDWMGFAQAYITYAENPRLRGAAGYSYTKLFTLALNSFVSLSLKPLYFAFYTGLFIMPLSLLLAVACGGEMLIGDPMRLNITGTAYLVMLALFLLGLVLISQGITALYLSHIYSETQNRPLFVVDAAQSANL